MRVDHPNYVLRTSRYANRRILLARTDISVGVASVSFALPATFESYELVASGILVQTDDVELHVRFSTDAGATYLSAAGSYEYYGAHVYFDVTFSAGFSSQGSASATQIAISNTDAGPGVGNGTGECSNVRIIMANANSDAMSGFIHGDASGTDASARISYSSFTGRLLALGRVNGLQILASSGNLTGGKFSLYGVGR